MDAEGPAQELAVLFPAPRSVVIAGRTIEIKRCGIAQSARVRELGAPILVREEDGSRTFEVWLAEEPEESAALIVAATGLDADWVASLDEEDRLELGISLWEVNEHFFAQRRMGQWARIKRLRESMITDLLGLGQPPSNGSTITATPIPAPTPESKPSSISPPSAQTNGASAAPTP